jgi:hypothetical protein
MSELRRGRDTCRTIEINAVQHLYEKESQDKRSINEVHAINCTVEAIDQNMQ